MIVSPPWIKTVCEAPHPAKGVAQRRLSDQSHPGADTVGAMFDLKRHGHTDDGGANVVASVVEIAIDLIDPDPNNPRQTIDAKSIEGLAQSIESEGLKQPITVRPHPTDAGRFMISYGERRYRAFKHLGRSSIPAIVGDDAGVRAGQLLENLQREGVRPIEEAIGIAQLVHEERAEKGDIARRLGMSGSAISQYLKVAAVGDDFLEEFRKRNLSLRAMYLLASAPLSLRVRLMKKSDAELTIKYIEAAVKREKDKAAGQKSQSRSSGGASRTSPLRKAITQFTDALDELEDGETPEELSALLRPVHDRIARLIANEGGIDMAAE